MMADMEHHFSQISLPLFEATNISKSRQYLVLLLFNLVNCDAVDCDPETAFAGEGWVHQERLNLSVLVLLYNVQSNINK